MILRAIDLRAGYRTGFRRVWRDVLQGVSFSVPRGSVTGYLGINGAGKTTTIKVVVGVNPASGGRVEVDGAPAGTPEAKRKLGYFPEAPSFYEGLSAAEVLDFFGALAGLGRAERARRGDELLEAVQLAAARDLPVRGYSKGMRQRLGLAQALLHDPPLLVLDEPLDGLDPMGRLGLRELIARQRERGRTVFFSSHVLGDVEAICDHLVVLDGGRVAYEGPTAGLAADPGGRTEVVLGPRPGAAPNAGPGADEDVRAALGDADGPRDGPALERRSDGSLVVACPAPEVVDRVIDAARAAGRRVLEVQRRGAGLEEQFLRRFGRPAQAPTAAREADAAAGAAERAS